MNPLPRQWVFYLYSFCMSLVMDRLLEKVKDFAATAHGDQQRKFEPGPYIIHPVRVMEIVREYTNDVSLLSAALLHDVLEDTEIELSDIHEFLHTIMSNAVATITADYVHQLTDIYTKNNYPAWNRKKRKEKEAERLARISPEAQTIKYADILDNVKSMQEAETSFKKKFLSECSKYLEVMKKGHPILRKKTIETVSTIILVT